MFASLKKSFVHWQTDRQTDRERQTDTGREQDRQTSAKRLTDEIFASF